MDASEVQDVESLRRYLEALPEEEQWETALRVMFRAVARLIPVNLQICLKRQSPIGSHEALDVFGPISVAGDVSLSSTSLTSAAVSAVDGPLSAAAEFASFAVDNAVATVKNIRFSTEGELFDLWQIVRADLAHPSGCVLWSGGQPNALAKAWQTAKTALQEDTTADWSFWIAWYERVLAGRDTLPDALAPIFNRLTEEDWEKGPAHINPLFDEVLALYQADESASTPLSRAYPVDFSFDTLRRVMRLIGIDDNMKHLRDPSIVQAFLDDAEQLSDDFTDFADYARELAPGGNYAGVLRRAAGKVIKEFDRTQDLTHLRAERLVQLGSELELFAVSEQGRADLGDPLAEILDKRIEALKLLCRKHFGPSYQTLAPLAELHLDQIDQESVLHLFDQAITLIESLPNDDLQPLDHEGLLVLQDMRDELKTYRAAIAEASSDDFRTLLQDRFAQSAGASGLSILRFLEKSGQAAGQGADTAIKNYKRVKSLADIFEVLKGYLSGGGL